MFALAPFHNCGANITLSPTQGINSPVNKVCFCIVFDFPLTSLPFLTITRPPILPLTGSLPSFYFFRNFRQFRLDYFLLVRYINK